jgi:hypothetical protein
MTTTVYFGFFNILPGVLAHLRRGGAEVCFAQGTTCGKWVNVPRGTLLKVLFYIFLFCDIFPNLIYFSFTF